MSLQQFFLILRAHYRVAISVFLLTVVATALVSLLMPKQYTATSALVIDVKSPDQISGQVLQGMMSPTYMATQIDIINSDRVAKEAAQLLDLAQDKELQAQWKSATKGDGDFLNWISTRIQKKLDVKPSRESNVIYVQYTSDDRAKAAQLANAFAEAYVNVNLELRLAPAKQYAAFFEDQAKTAKAKLESAQKTLSNYQQKHGITSADERLDFEIAKLTETSAQLTAVQGQTTDSQSKRFALKTDTLPEVMQSPLVNSLRTDISKLEAKLTESNVNLGKNHPQTKRFESELSTLKSQLSAEVLRITSSIDTSFQVGKQREEKLKEALASQKARVLMLNKQRDELSVMRREVESAQRNFENVSQRASQTNLESQTNQTNIAILNPAVPPTDPSKPKVLLNILASLFIGAIFGIGLSLGLELTNRRIRSTNDLAHALDIPVLGTINSARSLLLTQANGAAT
jgi:chain length determinant protein EpsF